MSDFIDNLKQQLIDHEGFRAKPYKCPAGKLTIGVGRNIEDNGISVEEAEFMLENDIKRCIEELRDIFKDFDTFGENQKMALIDFIFNIGKTTFLKFKKTISAIKNQDWEETSKEMQNSLWYKQVGNRGKFIVNQIKKGV
jgi:lysozyme